MTCSCKSTPGLFGPQAEMKHYVIQLECLECGYTWPKMERDEAAYCVRNFLLRTRCPACDAPPECISAAITVTPDRFTVWDGRVDMEVKSVEEVERYAKAIRGCQSRC